MIAFNRDYWPTLNWKSAPPESKGFDSNLLSEMERYISEKLPHIIGVMIIKDGYSVFEKYNNEFNKDSMLSTASISKTIISVLIGICLQEGFLKNIDIPMVEFFPEYITEKTSPDINKITIRNLLTMTSGFQWDDKTVIKKPENRKDLVTHAFTLPVSEKPGTAFNYSTLNSQLLSAIISKTTKMNAHDFAIQYLFKPLGIYESVWETDSRGYTYGGLGLRLKCTDMAKIGFFLLNNGLWETKQILTEEYVKVMMCVYTESGSPYNAGYGLHCWISSINGHFTYYGAGFGGQYLVVIPDLDMVVAMTSKFDGSNDENWGIIEKYIIPVFEG
jgi:CubicO group peptidase (beta-lactamase class C family)